MMYDYDRIFKSILNNTIEDDKESIGDGKELLDFRNNLFSRGFHDGFFRRERERQYVQLVLYYLFINADGKCTKKEIDIFNNVRNNINEQFLAEMRETCGVDVESEAMKKYYNDTRVTEEEIKGIKNFVDSIGFSENSDNSDIVISIIGEMFGFEEHNEHNWENDFVSEFLNSSGQVVRKGHVSAYPKTLPDYSDSRVNTDKVLQAQILWNLINICYAGKECSYSGFNVVDYLASKWEVDTVLYSSMIDVADTMLALIDEENFIDKRLENVVVNEQNQKDEINKERANMRQKKIKIQSDIKKLENDIKVAISEIIL